MGTPVWTSVVFRLLWQCIIRYKRQRHYWFAVVLILRG